MIGFGSLIQRSSSAVSTFRRMAWFCPAKPQTELVASTGILHDYCREAAYRAVLGGDGIFAYNASTLQLESNFVVTRNGFGGGIWASGGGPAADSNHNIYFSTGDGSYLLGFQAGTR